MLLIADYLTKKKIPCILDATFARERYRKEAAKIARKNKVPFYLLECICEEEIVKKRLRRKRKLSDADWKIYLKIKKEFEPIREKHLTINTSKGSKEAIKQLAGRLKLSCVAGS